MDAWRLRYSAYMYVQPPSHITCQILQRNKYRDIRHLFQQAAGPFSCSPFAYNYSAAMLEHVESAFDAYPDVPRFGHVHTSMAHSDTEIMERRRAFDHLVGPWLDRLCVLYACHCAIGHLG